MRALAWSLILALTTAPAIWSRSPAAEPEILELTPPTPEPEPPGGEPTAPRQWLCIADAATGFTYENGKWVTTTFNVEGRRWLLSLEPYRGPDGLQQGDVNDMRYYARKFGWPIGFDDPCEINRLGSSSGGIYCDVSLTELKINLDSLRYLAVYRAGYVDGKDLPLDTPHIERGTCSPL